MINGFAKEHLHITEDLFHHIEKIDFEQCNDYFRFKSGGDGDNGEVLMDEIDDYFINAYKYRWHDLRKNPNDLPTYADEKDWFVCLLENYDYNGPYHYFQYNCKLKEFGFYLTYKRSDDHDSGFEIIDGVEYDNVIAWKNIYPFKESEVIPDDFDSV